jgi:tetraacyldisaccharide 4'-kinase
VPDDGLLAERVWYGDGPVAGVLRGALAPLEGVYRLGVGIRNAMFDRRARSILTPPAPAIGIGNLSVGGTGKTPVSAWIAGQLREAGAKPAILMRGYGDDEPLVHARLNPDVPVITDGDRLRGARRAVEGGADCLVLDDAFQHRRIARAADVVLVSADRWDGRVRLLPAGPWREPLSALRRATLVMVTRKAVDRSTARSVASELAGHTSAPVAVVTLGLGTLRANDEERPVIALEKRRVLAIAAIGDAEAFRRQLERTGAVVRTAFFPDHHRFTARDALTLANRLDAGEWPVCTLKDYVKLAPLWPATASAFWYVSQRVAPESGESAVRQALDSVLHARTHHHGPPPAGSNRLDIQNGD